MGEMDTTTTTQSFFTLFSIIFVCKTNNTVGKSEEIGGVVTLNLTAGEKFENFKIEAYMDENGLHVIQKSNDYEYKMEETSFKKMDFEFAETPLTIKYVNGDGNTSTEITIVLRRKKK